MEKILFIQGSLSRQSKTAQLIQLAIQIAQKMGFETESIDLKRIDMPFCDGRKLDEYSQKLQPIYDQIESADYIVFGMPIYCYSISGPLKNFIDIFSKAFENKRFGICASAGSRMSYLATADLVKVLGYESNATGVQPMVFTDHHDYQDEKIVGDKVPERIKRMLESLLKCH